MIMAISACIIAKNEEEVIAGCLESLRGLAEEIILVDTGSTDDTKKIAERYGAIIHGFEWTDDFSAARNYSLSKATKEWILVIDADETISEQDHQKIRDAIKGAEHERGISGYMLVQRTYLNDSSSPAWQSASGDTYTESKKYSGWVPTKLVRLFRNNPEIRYEMPVHESVMDSIIRSEGKIKALEIPIHHYGKVRGEGYTKKKGELYYKLGEAKAAESEGIEAVKAQFELGVQANRLEKYEKAIECFEKVIRLKPRFSRAYVNLGVAYLKTGQTKKAIETLGKGIEKCPTSDIFNNLGIAYEEKGDIAKAYANYMRASQLNPNNIETHENLARIYYKVKNFEELIRRLEIIIRLDPKRTSAYLNLGGILLMTGKNTEAISVLERCISADKDCAEGYLNLGLAYLETKSFEKAIESFKKARSIDPRLDLQVESIMKQIKPGK